jgi:hypothetical protein
MALISLLGQFGGGRHVIPFYVDLVVVAVWSLIVYYTAIRLRLADEKVDEYVKEIYPVES